MSPPEPRRRRPAWLAPLVVGLAALLVGAGLAVGIMQQGDASSIADPTETSISGTVLPVVTTTASPSGDASSSNEPAVATTVAAVSVTAVSVPPVLEPLAPGSIRVDGETFIETYQCLAFAVSNPVTGSGDAGIRVALHQMQSATGARLSLERWRYDVGGAIGVAELSGDVGPRRTELVEFSVAPSDGIYTVPNGALVRRVELGELAEPSTLCSALVVDSTAEFRTYGLVDACRAPDEPASTLAEIFTLHDGVTLTRRTTSDSDRFVGELHHPDGTFAVADGIVRLTDRGTVELSGSLLPGPLSARDTWLLELASTPPSRSCLPEQTAAFAVG